MNEPQVPVNRAARVSVRRALTRVKARFNPAHTKLSQCRREIIIFGLTR